jgi:hypothetical protein
MSSRFQTSHISLRPISSNQTRPRPVHYIPISSNYPGHKSSLGFPFLTIPQLLMVISLLSVTGLLLYVGIGYGVNGPIFKSSEIDPTGYENDVYDNSTTPTHLPWVDHPSLLNQTSTDYAPSFRFQDTYNYCNSPHVSASTYVLPPSYPSQSKLFHLTTFIRHHKRSPDNLFPREGRIRSTRGGEWDCENFERFSFGRSQGVSLSKRKGMDR